MESIWIEVVLIAVAIVANGFFWAPRSRWCRRGRAGSPSSSTRGCRGRAGARAQRSRTPFSPPCRSRSPWWGPGRRGGRRHRGRSAEPLGRRLPVPGAARWAKAIALGVVIVSSPSCRWSSASSPEGAGAAATPSAWPASWRRLHLLSRLAAGPNRLLSLSTARSSPCWAAHAGQPPPVSEEEVKYLVREGVTHGVFEHHESELVQRIFDFTDARSARS